LAAYLTVAKAFNSDLRHNMSAPSAQLWVYPGGHSVPAAHHKCAFGAIVGISNMTLDPSRNPNLLSCDSFDPNPKFL